MVMAKIVTPVLTTLLLFLEKVGVSLRLDGSFGELFTPGIERESEIE
jgi:hypothetical protein